MTPQKLPRAPCLTGSSSWIPWGRQSLPAEHQLGKGSWMLQVYWRMQMKILYPLCNTRGLMQVWMGWPVSRKTVFLWGHVPSCSTSMLFHRHLDLCVSPFHVVLSFLEMPLSRSLSFRQFSHTDFVAFISECLPQLRFFGERLCFATPRKKKD